MLQNSELRPSVLSRLILCAFAIVVLRCSGATGNTKVERPTADPTPPTIHIGTAGLRGDVEVDSSRGGAVKVRGSFSNDVLIGATANDKESGIQAVEMTVNTSVSCVNGTIGTHHEWSTPVRTETPTGESSMPVDLRAFHTLKGAEVRALCPAHQFESVAIKVSALGTNGLGQSKLSPALSIIFDGGPEQLRVVELNVFQPILSKDDLSDVGQQVEDKPGLVKVNVWSALDNYAHTALKDVDLAFLTEMRNLPHIERLSQQSGLPYSALYQDDYYTDVAILSRYPLSEVLREGESDWINGANAIRLVTATMTVGQSRIHVLASHFPPRAGTEDRKKKYSDRIASLVASKHLPAFIGGDFNKGLSVPNATFVDVSADCNDDQRLLVVANSLEWQQPTVCSNSFPSDHAVITSTFWRGVE